MAKVYVTQLPSRLEDGSWVPTVNIEPAKEHGELVFLVPPGMNHPDAAAIMPQLRRKLEDFNAEDWLLPMGDPVIMAAAAALLGARMQVFGLLKWDRIARVYRKIEITVAS